MTRVVLSKKQMIILCFSSGVLDASEHDSNRKTRWNSTINQQDRTSASSSSECSPNSTLRKTKSRNEGTVLLRFAGDINILVTPLMLEALQRCVTIQYEISQSVSLLCEPSLGLSCNEGMRDVPRLCLGDSRTVNRDVLFRSLSLVLDVVHLHV